MKIPVIAATDPNTDIGDVLEKNKCGYKVFAGDISNMHKVIDEIDSNKDNYDQMSENAWGLLQREFKVDYSYQLIKNRLENV
jgi:glycosyltransferase involved in cell wall biosynthesis